MINGINNKTFLIFEVFVKFSEKQKELKKSQNKPMNENKSFFTMTLRAYIPGGGINLSEEDTSCITEIRTVIDNCSKILSFSVEDVSHKMMRKLFTDCSCEDESQLSWPLFYIDEEYIGVSVEGYDNE